MANLRLNVVHPPNRDDNKLVAWRGEAKPHAGGPETWSRLGADRAPDRTSLDVSNVPVGEHDFRVTWLDQFDQATVSEIVSYTVEPVVVIPGPLEAGSFTIERLPD
jgi:hypothetical protein